jgi:hypothetical protein
MDTNETSVTGKVSSSGPVEFFLSLPQEKARRIINEKATGKRRNLFMMHTSCRVYYFHYPDVLSNYEIRRDDTAARKERCRMYSRIQYAWCFQYNSI